MATEALKAYGIPKAGSNGQLDSAWIPAGVGVALASTAPADVTTSAADVGVGTTAARADHKHDISTAAPGATGVATASAEGTATSMARSDHAHQSNTAPVAVTKDTAAIGTSGEPARADHKHDITTATASAQVPGDSATEGTATSLARSDHKHSLPAYGTGASTICQGNDARLSDARTPTTHATSHKSGGSDAIKLDELAAPTDVTTLNATTGAHGLMMKYPGGTTNYLREDGTWQSPGGAPAGAAAYTMASTTAVTSTTAITYTAATGGAIAIPTTGWYRIFVAGRWQSAATGNGIGLQMTLPTNTWYDGRIRIQSVATGTDAFCEGGATSTGTSTNIVLCSTVIDTNPQVFFMDYLLYASTTGSATINFRAEVNTSGTSVLASTMLVLQKVA